MNKASPNSADRFVDPKPTSSASPREQSVLDWAHKEGAADFLIADLERYLVQRRQRRKRAVITMAVVLLVGGLSFSWWSRRAEFSTSSIARDAVVLKPVTRLLADGSTVELNAGAEIDVDFSGPFRRVVLRRGEGHFQVAKDAHRPFIVTAGDIEVRAVGTAFAVDRAAKKIEVLVTEGRVSVDQPKQDVVARGDSSTRANLGTLDAGRRMIVNLSPRANGGAIDSEVATISENEIHERLAWRVPRLEFAATPLAQAIGLFNEYASSHRGEQLVLGDASLGRLKLSGVLRADDIESLMRLLKGEFQIGAQRRENTIILSRR